MDLFGFFRRRLFQGVSGEVAVKNSLGAGQPQRLAVVGELKGIDGQFAGFDRFVFKCGEGLGETLLVESRPAFSLARIDEDEFALVAGQVEAVPEPGVVGKPVGADG